jgi:hypothetical protein
MASMTTKFSNSQHADPDATLRSIMAPWQRQYLQFEETFFKLQVLLAADGSGQSPIHTNM